MLTPEQLAGYREQAKGIGAFAELLAHIDAQQARIAELERQLASFTAGVKVSIPTETMEQEFAKHYKRGYAKGVQDTKSGGHDGKI